MCLIFLSSPGQVIAEWNVCLQGNPGDYTNREGHMPAVDIWDEKSVLEEFGGFEDLLVETCDLFVGLYGEHLNALSAMVEEQDLEGVCDEAHTIKGMVGYFNRGVVHRAAKKIEDKSFTTIYADNPIELKEDAENLRNLVEKLVAHIRAFRQRYKLVQ